MTTFSFFCERGAVGAHAPDTKASWATARALADFFTVLNVVSGIFLYVPQCVQVIAN
jgi:hypothetical protein